MTRVRLPARIFAGGLFTVLFVGLSFVPARIVYAADGLKEEKVTFESGEVTLHGTVLLPDGASSSPRPAVALVHGAGPGPRKQYRQEAEAFAREGIGVLIYDKRKKGYSQFERSYELLASDALAAVRTLRARPEVDPDAVGLWGLSEGGWVVPIAASHPEGQEAIDFVVLVAASGVPLAQQHSWNLENELRHQGVSGSMIRAISRTGVRLLVGTDLFPEAYHDPVGPLRNVQQPVLALWGAKDRIQPPAESARIVQEALGQSGNDRYTIRIFPDAEHGLRSSPDGFAVEEDLVPGYARTVGSWVFAVAGGEAPGPAVAGPTPEQARTSRSLPPLAWWESAWVQLGAVVLPALAFASYPAVAFARALASSGRERRSGVTEEAKLRLRRRARLLSATGLLGLFGFVGYFGYLMFTGANAVGPVLLGRALPWLALQALAVVACVAVGLLGASWWTSRKELGAFELVQGGVMLAGGLVFVVWAIYWGLLLP